MIKYYEELANAIILKAVRDCRRALRKHKKFPEHKPAIKTINEVEKFFLSEWYRDLTTVDGEMLIRRLRLEVEKI